MCSIHRALAPAGSALLLAFAVAACWADEETGAPLAIELSGPDAGQAGEEISVQYEVTGRQLVGIIFAWGDGAADSVPASGAQTASGSVRHTYTEAGGFTVTGRAEDLVEGFAEARVTIDISP